MSFRRIRVEGSCRTGRNHHLAAYRKNENTLKSSTTSDLGVMRSDETKVRQTLLNLLEQRLEIHEEGNRHPGRSSRHRGQNGDDSLSFVYQIPALG